MRHRFYSRSQLVARATTDHIGQRYLDHAAEMSRDPAVRALRLAMTEVVSFWRGQCAGALCGDSIALNQLSPEDRADPDFMRGYYDYDDDHRDWPVPF
jgi:hypothetical protein